MTIDDVEVELTISMSLRDWREFEAQLRNSTHYPAAKIAAAIADRLHKFNQVTARDGDGA